MNQTTDSESRTTSWDDRPTRLLLIEDDVHLTEAMNQYLTHAGYVVDVANSGRSGLAVASDRQPDLIVLDVMMRGMDGWEVCRRLRRTSNVPVIMLTARTNESDRVHGLRLGADDYVPKPFSLKELEARIEAVLRRARMVPPPPDNVVYEDDHLLLDINGLRVVRNGKALKLTATERRLLFKLAEMPGRVLTPRQILQAVWGPDYEGQSGYVKLYVWRLRQKIEPDPANPAYIRTERGVGYRFQPADGAKTVAGPAAGD